MIVSWNWLKEYVSLDLAPEEVVRRLLMAGLNHEGSESVGNDLAIDLEVTSNRPDCLGHIGIAREVAVLLDQPLRVPAATPRASAPAVAEMAKVSLLCPELCYRFTARVIRGVKVGPSPAWLADRLRTIGQPTINNVVDVTNYVLMECGQPLHAYDLARLAGAEIVVREGRAGERMEAIDHHTYDTGPGVCVIADRDRPVGIGGVMGGVGTEVTAATHDVLLEAAEFDPACIRATARRLNLHSDSSYRFERGLDPHGVEWASRRACELILDLAGGDLAAGVIAVGREPPRREPIVLRLSQLSRVLGIEIPPPRVQQILAALGNTIAESGTSKSLTVVPPTWRADLSREIDLVEEVARIHGYEAIPEDVSVPMVASSRTAEDRVLGRVRQVLTACGFDEALTVSVVDEEWSAAFSPWTQAEPLVCLTPVLRRADRLRRSLIPSLLAARRTNETLANPTIELFETARVYLPRDEELPVEEPMLAVTSGGDFAFVKGTVEALLSALHVEGDLACAAAALDLFVSARSCQLRLDGEVLGYLGELSAEGLKRFDLRAPTTVAELKLTLLVRSANLVPEYAPLPIYPAIARDLNLVVDESIPWSDLARVVRDHAGAALEDLRYEDTYRDAQRLGPGKKSLLLSVALRSTTGTLTSSEADAIRDRIVAACGQRLGAVLRGV